jgi:hypothetical protein
MRSGLENQNGSIQRPAASSHTISTARPKPTRQASNRPNVESTNRILAQPSHATDRRPGVLDMVRRGS